MYLTKRIPGTPRASFIRTVYSPYIVSECVKLNSSHRFLHATHQRQSQILDVCLSQTHTLLGNLHTVTGLSWVLTLPLAALLIRGVIITPMMIYNAKNRERVASSSPFLYAWSHVLQRKVNKEHGSLGPEKAEKILKADLKIKKAELYRTMKISTWKSYVPLLQFPVWLLMIETIRKMSGAPNGLLSLLAKPFSQTVEQNRETTLQAINSNIPVEQSFSIEGALWFHNLLAPDPQLILPFLLSGILFGNIYRQGQVVNASGVPVGKWGNRYSNSLKVVALAVGPLTLQVPTAMLVYWITSSTFALLSNETLDRIYPPARRMVPCKLRSPIGALDMNPKTPTGSKS